MGASSIIGTATLFAGAGLAGFAGGVAIERNVTPASERRANDFKAWETSIGGIPGRFDGSVSRPAPGDAATHTYVLAGIGASLAGMAAATSHFGGARGAAAGFGAAAVAMAALGVGDAFSYCSHKH